MEAQLRSHPRRRRVLLTAALLALAATPGAFAGNPAGGPVGSSAPDFALPAQGGANLRLSEHRGEVVMINFWATWCGPCRQELPKLEELHGLYADAGFTLLGVNIDEDRARAERMAGELGVTFPVLFDDEQSVSRLYDVQAMPMTVFVDKDGRVRSVHHGYRPGVEALYLDELRALLRED